ncbi:MAG: hypothetical protein K0R26_1587 [Bacteroidota bacterium]|jgi:hypothetical protein|nr:hypothetical protein [Bacteroidota bacterium]
MIYKGIRYSCYREHSALLFKQHGNFDLEYIMRSTTLIELAGHVKPDYLIIDRKNVRKPPAYFIQILEDRIFEELKGYGIKHVFFILPAKELEDSDSYFKDKTSFATLTGSLQEVFGLIDEMKAHNQLH